MKKILVFGAGKSSTVLIQRLLETCGASGWHLTVADLDAQAVREKLGGSSHATALIISVQDDELRGAAIGAADLVISLLPPFLHNLVAADCLHLGRHLLTASYASPELLLMHKAATAKGLLFLCEMGLDPGIDHMSAMQMIDQIRSEGGIITGFQSHCGGLVSPGSDDNPWHYKISWNPANVVSAGMDGAVYLENSEQVHLGYKDIFTRTKQIDFPGLGRWAVYPNRDSLRYRELYDLSDTRTFIRTTIRHPDFIKGWRALVESGLTGKTNLTEPLSFAEWSRPLTGLIDDSNRSQIEFLDILDDQTAVPVGVNSALILQSVLEKKLAMRPTDRDMILMLHEVNFTLNGKTYREESSFRLDGFDARFTAMASTVGLPLVHAAELILKGGLPLTGVQIPTSRIIYEKVLPGLARDGIVFTSARTIVSTTPGQNL